MRSFAKASCGNTISHFWIAGSMFAIPKHGGRFQSLHGTLSVRRADTLGFSFNLCAERSDGVAAKCISCKGIQKVTIHYKTKGLWVKQANGNTHSHLWHPYAAASLGQVNCG